jgi:hypothetical protein
MAICAVVWSLTLATSVCAGPPLSSVPFIYVIDYGDHWIKDAAAAEAFGDMPPDLLHIGKAVPVTHNWGPIPLLAGENQYTGGPGHTLDRNAIRLLTPEELEKKIQDITAAVERLHAAGIPQVMPYICFYTMAGDHETREGLWQFYDKWDAYVKWMGPKPPTDPSDWWLRDATGKRIESGYGFTPPYFAPLHRYAACPNNPGWNQFSVAVVKLIAQCGYDGVFVDNATIGGDQCRYCQEAFARWVGENFDSATLKRACRTEDPGPVSLANPKLSFAVDRWHAAVVRDRLAMLRRAGAEIKPGFQVFANCGRYQWAVPLGDGCDLFMFEGTDPPGRVVEGEPPASPEALIEVAPQATLEMNTFFYKVRHSDRFAEVEAQVKHPRICPVGQPVTIAVRFLGVGASNQDSDCLEDVSLRITNLATGQFEDVKLEGAAGVGDPNTVPGARRPPIVLSGTWTPAAPGSYALDLRYRYTDPGHRDAANRVLISDRLTMGAVYRVNLPGLSLTYNSRCKTIALTRGILGKGREAIEELALAEGGAAGGRHAVQSKGEPQKKYWRFFHRYGKVGAGLVPWGPVTILYSYWGPNPGNIGGEPTQTIAEYLSAHHVLFRGLVDRDLAAADLGEDNASIVILVCGNYDLTAEQVAALRHCAQGGRLLVEKAETTVNFAPLHEALGIPQSSIKVWDWDNPPALAPELCEAQGNLQGVRFTCFAEPTAAPKRLVIHALNYNVSLVGESVGQLSPITGLKLRLPLPQGWAGARATVYDPDAEQPCEAQCVVKDGTLEVGLPNLRIYQMIELVAQ